jgi:hypothetical protein
VIGLGAEAPYDLDPESHKSQLSPHLRTSTPLAEGCAMRHLPLLALALPLLAFVGCSSPSDSTNVASGNGPSSSSYTNDADAGAHAGTNSGGSGASGNGGTAGSSGGSTAGSTSAATDDGGAANGSTGTATDDGGAGREGASTDGDLCVQKINAYRARVGAPPLVRNTAWEGCATTQATKGAADLAATGVTTFHKYYGLCHENSQNEAWYSAAAVAEDMDASLQAMWNEGPPPAGELNHYAVMADPSFTSVACGFAPLAAGGNWETYDFYP